MDSIETRPWGPGDTNVVYCLRLCQADNGSSLQKQATDTLYVSQYPMPPELLMGLRPGAVLRAVNVHPLPFENPHVEGGMFNYGACLRSTVTLIQSAGERDGGDELCVDDLTLSRGAMRKHPTCRPYGHLCLGKLENRMRRMSFDGIWNIARSKQGLKAYGRASNIDVISLRHLTRLRRL